MKRNSTKTKQPIQQNHKISKYFTKLTSSKLSTSSVTNKPVPVDVTGRNGGVIILDDSDEEIPECSNHIPSVPPVFNTILKPIINQPQSSKTPDIYPVTPERRKRKLNENSPSPEIIPSSLNSKHEAKLKRCDTLTRSNIIVENLSGLDQTDYIHITSPSKNERDLKQSPLRLHCKSLEQLRSLSKPNGLIVEDTKKLLKTPRKSPNKLFNKSPKSLHTFNVDILENFIKAGPAKERSPVPVALVSTRSTEMQQFNERTPTKSPLPVQVISPKQQIKVKTKLNFSPSLETKNTCSVDASNGTVQDNFESMLSDDWEDNWHIEETLDSLDLSTLQRCKITKIVRLFAKVKLWLKSIENNTTAYCIVEGFWHDMRMEENDTVSISATYDSYQSAWHICNEYGLIVYEPDFLVSSTSVVGAQFCRRRSVLNEFYRGFEPSNRIMVIGILVHQLFQEVLRTNSCCHNDIDAIVKKLMADKNTVWTLYESRLNVDDVMKEILVFIPKLIEFMQRYIKQPVGVHQRSTIRDNWKGKIDSVQDIEENIWCPKLGLKGKVDVSVLSGKATYPLELKTGRASCSLEHRGQVMLYIMMMQQFGYKVPSGLLLYLREGVLREIPIMQAEKRDLILLRNELTYYLTKHVKPEQSMIVLPEPINHHNACSKCPYNVICCTYLKYENFNLENNPLKSLQQDVLNHLEPEHLDYFVKWCSLLSLEAGYTDGSKKLKDIYTTPPEKRAEKGQCIIGVHVMDVVENGGTFKHTFGKVDPEKATNLLTSGLNTGDYVVVSTETRPAVATGILTSMDSSSVTINLDRNLNKRYSHTTFHLDTYNSGVGHTLNMTNLALLLEASEQAAKLRKIIIDKTPPTFQSILPKAVATKGTPILRTLNKNQQKAVLKALSCNDYLLIKGMPGTGKTATIVALIRILVELGKTVLVTSHTHSAVDNVCIRLQKCGVKLLRLGLDSKIHPALHNSSESKLTQHCMTPEQLNTVYNSAQVIAVTCLGSGHSVLSRRQLDVCIVDESTQILQCSVIRTLYASQKFILIGDSDQLPPIVRNREAVKKGLSQSLFERLDMPSATVSLTYNYRMNKPITDMANALTYKGELLIANSEVGEATLYLPKLNDFKLAYENQPWILQVLEETLSSAVKILDTGPTWMRLQQSVLETSVEMLKCSNQSETSIVVKLVKALLTGGVCTNSIGVIAPYRAQVAAISSALQNKDVEVSTVDQFQGRDKEIVIYSCTKSTATPSLDVQNEILEDSRRLTVAITRAKHKFILIGDLMTIKRYSPFAKLLNCIDKGCFLTLKDGELGFNWALDQD